MSSNDHTPWRPSPYRPPTYPTIRLHELGVPDVLQVYGQMTDKHPAEVQSLCRLPGEPDDAFIARAHTVAHAMCIRRGWDFAEYVQFAHYMPDLEGFSDANFNYVHAQRFTRDDPKAGAYAQITACQRLNQFWEEHPEGWG